MKIAVFITGFLRHARRSRKYLFDQFYKDHECDVYVATWDERGISLRETKSIVDDQHNVDEEYIKQLYGDHVKGVWIGNLDSYNKTRKAIQINERPNDIFKTDGRAMEHARQPGTENYPYWPNRLLDQWYVVKQARNIISSEEFNSYDIIYKSRADLNFVTTIPITCPNNGIHTSSFYWNGHTMEDKFAWGSPKYMNEYMLMYDYIQEMYDKDNIDISWAEHLMAYYLLKWKQIPVCTHAEFFDKYGAHIYDPLKDDGEYEFYKA